MTTTLGQQAQSKACHRAWEEEIEWQVIILAEGCAGQMGGL